MRNRSPIAKFNYLVKRFVLCTLTLEEAKKAAKNVITQWVPDMDPEMDALNLNFQYWKHSCVAYSFNWSDAPEGVDYWIDVSSRLYAAADVRN